MLNIHEVLSPGAILAAKILGYGLLFVAWATFVFVGMRLYNEGRALYRRSR